MTNEITGNEDFLDSRDVIARIEALREERDAYAGGEEAWLEDCWIEAEELDELERLAAECSGCGDWEYGETLINSDAFPGYAEELVKDCGYIPSDLPDWIVIDWEATADNVANDYMSVGLFGQLFFIRA